MVKNKVRFSHVFSMSSKKMLLNNEYEHDIQAQGKVSLWTLDSQTLVHEQFAAAHNIYCTAKTSPRRQLFSCFLCCLIF